MNNKMAIIFLYTYRNAKGAGRSPALNTATQHHVGGCANISIAAFNNYPVMRIMMVIVRLSGGVCSITGTLHYPVTKIDDLHISSRRIVVIHLQNVMVGIGYRMRYHSSV